MPGYTLGVEMHAGDDRLWVLPLSALLAGAGYEAAVAVGALEVGPLPGSEPPGRTAVFMACELALLGGSLAAAARATASRRGGLIVVLVPPAAGAFLLARFFSFDAYYAPTLRRMSADGLLAPELAFALAGGCAVAALMLRRRPRLGFALTAALLFLVAVAALAAGAGH